MNQPSNTKNTKTPLTEQKHDLLKSGKIKSTPVAPNVLHGVIPSVGGDLGTCFVAGSLVLMADMSWKAIEDVSVGEMMYSVDGPVACIRQHVTRLGNRKMITFDDESLFWSEEHAFWTRLNDKEWWWSYNANQWRWEVEVGMIGGLLDNNSIRNGELLIEYAHLDGWKLKKSKVANGDFNEYTPLYVPITDGAPIVVNGYLVGAAVNEYNFDYKKIEWNGVLINREELNLV